MCHQNQALVKYKNFQPTIVASANVVLPSKAIPPPFFFYFLEPRKKFAVVYFLLKQEKQKLFYFIYSFPEETVFYPPLFQIHIHLHKKIFLLAPARLCQLKFNFDVNEARARRVHIQKQAIKRERNGAIIFFT